MEKIPLSTTDITLSRMGLGTWATGGGSARDSDLDRQVYIDTIPEAHRCGINLTDTAPGYNSGNDEVIVDQMLKKLSRERVVVGTKYGIAWERKGGSFNKVSDWQLYRNLSSESIHEEVKASLQCPGIDHVDIYTTHWQSVPPFLTPMARTIVALSALKTEGKTRAIGAANIDVGHTREHLQHGELDIIQAKYSILDRAIENELLPLCRDNSIVVQIYSPLKQGLLIETITRDYVPGGARASEVWFQRENMLKVTDMFEQWQPLCAHYQCTIPTLALAWMLKQSDLISILSGVTAPEQVCENVATLDIDLSGTDATLMREMVETLER